MAAPIFEALSERVLIYDGAMGTQIQAANLTADDFILKSEHSLSPSLKAAAQRLDGKNLEGCNELLNITRPEVIEAIHTRYLEAGSDLVETNTFGTTSIVLAEYQIEELVYDLSLAAGQIARRAADKVSTTQRPRFVVGAIGPGTKLVSLGQTTFTELENTYCDSFRGLLDGGTILFIRMYVTMLP